MGIDGKRNRALPDDSPKGEKVAPAAVAVLADPQSASVANPQEGRTPSNRVRNSQAQNRFPNFPQPTGEGG